ncbi:MAG: hypothetical protein HGA67_02100 [Candidatus Yonathbacteria bacterium]|nr:hypothetical protein [Candidatus Yonathbacteria bacterium]
MKNPFFFVYRQGGWEAGIIAKLAKEYGKYNKDVYPIDDQPRLLRVDDYISAAVPFLFYHLLGLSDVIFLSPESFVEFAGKADRRTSVPLAKMILRPEGMFCQEYQTVCDQVLHDIGAPSDSVKNLLQESALVLKHVMIRSCLE